MNADGRTVADGGASVTVAIPVRDGGELLARTFAALARQTVAHELLVCDSGSTDGSLEVARDHGARVLRLPASQFSHGGTRNLLMREAEGTHVAFLTQDAEPADERWLEHMLAGFELAANVGIVYGPYRPRPWASVPVRIELERWFGSLAPDGRPTIERLDADERSLPDVALIGRRGFFTDANACVAHPAWERVPFRDVPYAEDRALAIDMLRAGYAKAYVPRAAVIHSHNYTSSQQLRRSFDEWRGLRDIYGWREPASPAHALRSLRGELGATRRDQSLQGASAARRLATLAAVARYNLLRQAGATLGSRAALLPRAVRARLSLEGRSGSLPLSSQAGRGERGNPGSAP